jgi:hypothetical protein
MVTKSQTSLPPNPKIPSCPEIRHPAICWPNPAVLSVQSRTPNWLTFPTYTGPLGKPSIISRRFLSPDICNAWIIFRVILFKLFALIPARHSTFNPASRPTCSHRDEGEANARRWSSRVSRVSRVAHLLYLRDPQWRAWTKRSGLAEARFCAAANVCGLVFFFFHRAIPSPFSTPAENRSRTALCSKWTRNYGICTLPALFSPVMEADRPSPAFWELV